MNQLCTIARTVFRRPSGKYKEEDEPCDNFFFGKFPIFRLLSNNALACSNSVYVIALAN